MDDNSKKCNTCQEWKSRTSFHKDRSLKDGLKNKCIDCVKGYNRLHAKRDAEKSKEYRAKNSERISLQKKQYYLDNKDTIDRRNREWAENNKEARKEYFTDYYARNKEHISEYSKQHYKNNKEVRREQQKEWYRSNLDKYREYSIRYRAIKKGLTVEKVDYQVIRERDDICYLCQIPFTDEERWDGSLTHVDHKIPLSRLDLNPTHSYENCALTHKVCNLSKGDKTPDEYWVSAN